MQSTKKRPIQQTIVPNIVEENSLAVTMPMLNFTEISTIISSCGELGADPSLGLFCQAY